jgi:hypothetical protein
MIKHGNMVLHPGRNYAAGCKAANDACERLATALVPVGLADKFAYLKPDVNVFGTGLVQLGTVTPATAHALAELLMEASREVTEGRPQIRAPVTDQDSAA